MAPLFVRNTKDFTRTQSSKYKMGGNCDDEALQSDFGGGGNFKPLLCCKELLVAIRADQQSPGRVELCC